MTATLPHARERVPDWIEAWNWSGRLVLLLDFDGTLAPIVDRPEDARPLPAAIEAIEALRRRGDVDVAVVSGRGLDDARSLSRLEGIAFAGNHGMEIEGPGLREVHEEAAAARPVLDEVQAEVRGALADIEGALVEDKGLTLSVHYRLVRDDEVERVRDAVRSATASREALRVTEGKRVLEIRPRVDWHKGRAVEFLLEHLRPPHGAPVLYLGDDTTDEDAFRALNEWSGGSGEGVLVAPTELKTAARSRVDDPHEAAELLAELVRRAP
jgi:trehalose 6-phosphate phosphatase